MTCPFFRNYLLVSNINHTIYHNIAVIIETCCETCCVTYIFIFYVEIAPRTSTMKKSNLSAKAKEKWERVLKSELMSSEEIGEDDTIIVKPLRWRAGKLSSFFHISGPRRFHFFHCQPLLLDLLHHWQQLLISLP